MYKYIYTHNFIHLERKKASLMRVRKNDFEKALNSTPIYTSSLLTRCATYTPHARARTHTHTNSVSRCHECQEESCPCRHTHFVD